MSTEEALSGREREEIDHWLAKFPESPAGRRSAVIPALRIVQENRGWLPEAQINAVAGYLGLPATAAYEVATFYTQFKTSPGARHTVNICTNISCMLCGGEEMVTHAEEKLGINLGDTTADGRITLQREEECLAACAGAPMMLVDEVYYTDLTPEKIDQILDSLE